MASPDSLTVWNCLGETFDERCDEVAIVATDGSLTFGELNEQVIRAANAFIDIGVEQGAVLAASTSNRAELIVAFLAAMRIGAIWVGLNRNLSVEEKLSILDHAEVRALLIDSPDASLIIRHFRRRRDRIVFTLRSEADPAEMSYSWRSTIASSSAEDRPRSIDPEAPAAIMYTSGTTSNPKTIVHSQHNLAVPAMYLAELPDFAQGTRTGVCLPLTITNVMVIGPMAALCSGVTSVLVSELTAVGVAGWVERERITSMTMPPPIVYDLCQSSEVVPEMLRSLLFPRSGGSYLPAALGEQYRQRFGRRIVRTYGMSEVPTVVAIEDRSREYVEGSSGRVVPYLKVEVLDPVGSPRSPGIDGEIVVSAAMEGRWAGMYRPMLGYWSDPDRVSPVDVDGRLHTGDIGHLDGEGNLFVTGRSTNVILRGGTIVLPADIEEIIERHICVSGCVVVGIPDDRLGEKVAAVIEVKNGGNTEVAKEILDLCRAAMELHKVPQQVVLVDELPRGAMGKIDRVIAAKLVSEVLPSYETHGSGNGLD